MINPNVGIANNAKHIPYVSFNQNSLHSNGCAKYESFESFTDKSRAQYAIIFSLGWLISTFKNQSKKIVTVPFQCTTYFN